MYEPDILAELINTPIIVVADNESSVLDILPLHVICATLVRCQFPAPALLLATLFRLAALPALIRRSNDTRGSNSTECRGCSVRLSARVRLNLWQFFYPLSWHCYSPHGCVWHRVLPDEQVQSELVDCFAAAQSLFDMPPTILSSILQPIERIA